MTISGIFFDAAGVLYDRAESTSAFFARLLSERGFSPSIPAEGELRHRALRSRAKRGQISAGDYWDHRLQMHGVADAQQRKALAGAIGDHSDQVKRIPGGLVTLSSLKRRGFVLGVVTDTIYPIERKQRWLDGLGIGLYLDVLACSTALGLHKPEPAIYQHTVRVAGLTPAESAFVGHAADELEGARRAGLVTVAVYYDPSAVADYYADSLLDLLSLPIFAERKTDRPET